MDGLWVFVTFIIYIFKKSKIKSSTKSPHSTKNMAAMGMGNYHFWSAETLEIFSYETICQNDVLVVTNSVWLRSSTKKIKFVTQITILWINYLFT